MALSRARIGLKLWLKTLLVFPGLLLRRRGPSLRVLMYHRVNAHPFERLGPVSRELSVHPDVFEAQLRYLARTGWHSVGLERFRAMLSGEEPVDPRAILITFDDGYVDNLKVAAPILAREGFSAVVFPVSGFLGRATGEVWPNADPPGLGDFLDGDGLRDLHRMGVEIGSHTVSHPMLSGLTGSGLDKELAESRLDLERIVGTPVLVIAYPGGDFNAETEAAARRAGYRLGFTTVTGTNRPGAPAFALRRTEVSASDSMFVFRMKLAGALDWLALKESAFVRTLMRHVNERLIPLASGRPRNGGS